MNLKYHANPQKESHWVNLGMRLASNKKLLQFLSFLSILLSAFYLIWRLVYTFEGSNPILFWVLWSAEFVGWLSLFLFIRDSWALVPEEQPVAAKGSTTIFIPTYDEPIDVLEPTIVAALAVKGAKEVWVLDDGKRSWVQTLASEYGVKWITREKHEHAKAGNVNNALALVKTDFILVLDADHIANSLIVEKLKARFTSDDVALVQSPHGFRNLDSAQHLDSRVNEQSLFFEILLPGRNATDSVFWCGSGALLRVAALNSVGGVQTRTITEDLETSIAMQRRGWRSVYHNETLLQGLAPANLSSFLLQRYRWARGTIEVLTSKGSPIFGKGFKLSTRLSFLSNLLYYLVPIQHLAFVIVLDVTLVTGLLPVNMSLFWVFTLWIPQILLSMVIVVGMSAGRQLPLTGSRNAWLTSSIYIKALFDRILQRKSKFQVTPKEGVEDGGFQNIKLLWLPAVAVVSLALSVVIRLIEEATPGNQIAALHPVGIAVSIWFAVYEIVLISPILVKAFFKQQVRSTWRYNVHLQAKVAGFDATVTDLHLTGLQFTAHQDSPKAFEVGGEYEIQVRLSSGQLIKGVATAKRVAFDETIGRFTVGAAVTWKATIDRAGVIREAYIPAASEEVNHD